MDERKFGNTCVTLVRGDIAAQDTDAVVNAANNHLWMGAGVAGAIKRSGGDEIEKEAVSKGPVKVGETVTTGGGRLAAQYVIHAAAMGDAPTDVTGATRAAFAEAGRLSIKSISLPALGTGVAGFPIAECARIMLRLARETAEQGSTSLEEIRFVLWGKDDLQTFRSILEGL